MPHTILFVPLYQVVIRLGLDDNLLALLLVYPMLALPFCVWLLSAYWARLPRELLDQARIDGATPVQVQAARDQHAAVGGGHHGNAVVLPDREPRQRLQHAVGGDPEHLALRSASAAE